MKTHYKKENALGRQTSFVNYQNEEKIAPD